MVRKQKKYQWKNRSRHFQMLLQMREWKCNLERRFLFGMRIKNDTPTRLMVEEAVETDAKSLFRMSGISDVMKGNLTETPSIISPPDESRPGGEDVL